MAEISRPDGARIHYEVFGSGHPLVLIAPGGVNSEIGFWEMGALNPIELFSEKFKVIGIDQRYAGASMPALKPFSYEDAVGDVLAVMDDVGAERAHVWGGCIGCAYIWALLGAASERFSAAVCQDPVGLDATNSMDVFTAMFIPTLDLARREGVKAVIASARENSLFVASNEGGPLARAIASDEAFASKVEALGDAGYVSFVESFERGIWPENAPYLTATEEWMKECTTPLLVLPGSDPFHPTSVGRLACEQAQNAQCLDVDARSDAKRETTIETIGEFLSRHSL